jgi:hypothetical protein
VAYLIGLACVAYSAIIAVTLAIGEKSAPWLPTEIDPLTAIPALAALFVSGAVAKVVSKEIRQLREERPPPLYVRQRQASRPRSPMPAISRQYFLGFKWLFTGWRIYIVGPFSLLAIAVVSMSLTVPEIRNSPKGKPPVDQWPTALFFGLLFVWSLVLKGKEIQKGKERMKVADEYLQMREERLHREFDALCEKFLEQQQDWRAEQTHLLYEQVLDQQARGLLPCPKCSERHGERRKSA